LILTQVHLKRLFGQHGHRFSPLKLSCTRLQFC